MSTDAVDSHLSSLLLGDRVVVMRQHGSDVVCAVSDAHHVVDSS